MSSQHKPLPDMRPGSPVRILGDEHLKALGLGLSGAHRTGKSTIAEVLAQENDKPFLTSSASAIAKEMGIEVRPGMPNEERRRFQDAILLDFTRGYGALSMGGVFITDRTPIDLAAYAMADWRPGDEEHDAWLVDYVQRCLEVTSQFFFMTAIIQPGIPYVVAEGKPAPNEAYQEMLNTLMIGLAKDPRQKAFVTVVRREITDTDARVSLLTDDYSRRITGYRDNIAGTLGIQ